METNRTQVHCRACGARVSLPAPLPTCAFCGSPQLEPLPSPLPLQADMLLPFFITPGRCAGLVQKWAADYWLAPSELRQWAKLGLYTPIFLPFWAIELRVPYQWSGVEVFGLPIEVVDELLEDLLGRELNTFDKSDKIYLVFYPATRYLGEWVLRDVANFKLTNAAIAFDPSALVSKQAQLADKSAHDLTRQERSHIIGILSQHMQLPMQYTLREFTDKFWQEEETETWHDILMPAYLAAFNYRQRHYRLLINGQSGRISGQVPVDWNKVYWLIAAMLLPGVLLAGLILAMASRFTALELFCLAWCPTSIFLMSFFGIIYILREAWSY